MKDTHRGARTRDHKIKSLALYHLSYGGTSVTDPLPDATLRAASAGRSKNGGTQARDRTGDLLRVKQTS